MHVTHRPRSHERPNRPRLLQAGCRKARRTFVVASRRSVALAAAASLHSGGRDRSRCGHRRSRRERPAPAARRHYGRQPVVTTRTMPQPTTSYGSLAQVMPPRDGLPWPVLPRIRATRSALSPVPRGHLSHDRADQALPSSRGSTARPDESTSRRKRHRRQERVQPWQATGSSARIGSGVPRPLQLSLGFGRRDGQKH
jgi:hypothetical protein